MYNTNSYQFTFQ